MTVLAVTSWRDNASLIADAVVPLGYIKPTDRVIDVTYGRGLWWNKYQHPGPFAAMTGEHVDYRSMPEIAQASFDVVAYDPPYVAMGGRATSKLPDFMDRFGLENAATTPRELHWDNTKGLRECARICRPGGLILVKCCSYVSSGKMFAGSHMMWLFATDTLGLELVDEFTMVGHSRAQPPGRRQVHARQNSSTLFVFQKPRRKA